MMDSGHSRRTKRDEELAIDGIVSTQPELGPSIPDGGYGWVVFFATLFFQVSKFSTQRLSNLNKTESFTLTMINITYHFVCYWIRLCLDNLLKRQPIS